jgi:transcriptional regulator with XRE-family HTH domain
MDEEARLRSLCEWLGANVARLRKKSKWTQAQMAEKLGLSHRYFQRLERGRVVPSFSTWVHIAQVLGVDERSLLEPEQLRRGKPGRPRRDNHT